VRSTERPFLGLSVILLAVTGCAAATPSATRSPAAATEAASATPTPTPGDEVEPQPSPPGLALPEPGQPFDAATLLAAMRESRRPGGVPDELETDAIATALAGAIWTFDGQPWTTTTVSGSCGPSTCTLEVAGVRADLAGDDLWVFAVSLAPGSVEVVATDVRALPAELPIAVDELVRSLDTDRSLAGMLLTSLKWLPPPDDGRFLASYRSGGEEGLCGVDVTVDAVNSVIVSEQRLGC
jgi:hypothetical protein